MTTYVLSVLRKPTSPAPSTFTPSSGSSVQDYQNKMAPVELHEKLRYGCDFLPFLTRLEDTFWTDFLFWSLI
jgi:hypothetical protein